MAKKSKEPQIVCQGFDGDPWVEWARLTAIAGSPRYMQAGRSFTVVLSDCGVELASRVETSTRGKVTQIAFFFTGATRPDYSKEASRG
jgi:hypothetical protein